MEKSLRAVVHDVAEVAGLVAHSVGSDEDGDRRVIIWKKEAQPSDEELVNQMLINCSRYQANLSRDVKNGFKCHDMHLFFPRS